MKERTKCNIKEVCERYTPSWRRTASLCPSEWAVQPRQRQRAIDRQHNQQDPCTTRSPRSRCSSRIGLILLIAINILALVQAQTQPAPDCEALVQLYYATSSKPWINSTGWITANTTTPDCCTWYGVTCQPGSQRVTMVNLTKNGLLGTIPPVMGLLSRLTHLILADNMMKGTIPAEITLLKGDFSCGSYDGASCNPFAALDPNVGCPGTTCNAYGGLVHLDLSKNRFSGQIPDSFSRLYRTLKHLDLSSNRLTGSIPATLGALNQAVNLNLFFNRLGGTIPGNLGWMVSLKNLNLAFNRLTGTVPHFLGNLQVGYYGFALNVGSWIFRLVSMDHVSSRLLRVKDATYIHTRTYTNPNARTTAHAHVNLITRTHTRTHISSSNLAPILKLMLILYIHIKKTSCGAARHLYTYVHIHTYIHTYIHKYIHEKSHVFIHTHTHTHTCMCACSCIRAQRQFLHYTYLQRHTKHAHTNIQKKISI
jgi:hypothetical protein